MLASEACAQSGKGKRKSRRGAGYRSLAQAEACNEFAVALGMAGLEIVEKLAPAIDHAQQTLAGVVVLRVCLEVTREIFDAGGQQATCTSGDPVSAAPRW